jgi:THAP4-like, heme-binding beta-barrel domain
MTTTDLTPLIGRWTGRGRGSYPTIADFEYLETITITASPKGFLVYQQTTKHPETGLPMHAEMGYFRPLTDGRVELLLAQPNGIAELHSGTVVATADEWRLALDSTTIGRTESAKRVGAVARRITVSGDELRYELHMSAVGQPLQFHLTALLQREA